MAELPSPLTPEINTLLEQAQVDFRRYGGKLFEAVMRLVQNGKLLPMTDATRTALENLYRDHAAELIMRFAGTTFDHEALARVLRAGTLKPGYEGWRGNSTLAIMYRAGKAAQVAGAPQLRGQVVPLEVAMRQAHEASPTSRDTAALNYIQQRGALYMRRPVDGARTAVDRVLTDAEFGKVREAQALGVREGFSTARLARELADATKNTTLLNDMTRVARTEGMFAVHAGALVSLREHAGRQGLKDPEVYKIISPGACQECRRIWGDFGTPRVYRLSEIEGQSNFGKPAREWGPTIGPTHPHCTCPPLMIFNRQWQDAIKKAGERMRELYGD